MPDEVSEQLVEAVSSQLPEITDEQVAMVLTALNTVREGSPLGTIVTDPESGAVAVRVSDNGIHMWKVTAPDGGTWGDMQPTLPGWTVLREVTDE